MIRIPNQEEQEISQIQRFLTVFQGLVDVSDAADDIQLARNIKTDFFLNLNQVGLINHTPELQARVIDVCRQYIASVRTQANRTAYGNAKKKIHQIRKSLSHLEGQIDDLKVITGASLPNILPGDSELPIPKQYSELSELSNIEQVWDDFEEAIGLSNLVRIPGSSSEILIFVLQRIEHELEEYIEDWDERYMPTKKKYPQTVWVKQLAEIFELAGGTPKAWWDDSNSKAGGNFAEYLIEINSALPRDVSRYIQSDSALVKMVQRVVK